jgi:4,5-DOPA dioxygenase extradiol
VLSDPMLPVLFVSHGAPLVAIDGDPVQAAWVRLASCLPRPAAVLVMSPHWPSTTPLVASPAVHRTLHDFGGMSHALYTLDYPAPGDPALAEAVCERLRAAGFDAAVADRQGLDHGAWVPLRVMYPRVDVPVVQLTVQPRLGPQHHYALGEALAALRADDVLVIGSGAITHNLREVRLDQRQATVPRWVRDFAGWMAAELTAGNVDRLLDYRRLAPDAERNHPTEEHLLPLFFACGAAAGTLTARRVYEGYSYGLLAMDAWAFGEGAAATGPC